MERGDIPVRRDLHPLRVREARQHLPPARQLGGGGLQIDAADVKELPRERHALDMGGRAAFPSGRAKPKWDKAKRRDGSSD